MWVLYKMETQKIINLWNDSSSEKSKFATKNWCVMDSQTAKGKYNQNYTTECLLDYAYFKDNYRIVAVDLSKKRALDADPRAIQQTVFQKIAGGADSTTLSLCTILETSKETVL